MTEGVFQKSPGGSFQRSPGGARNIGVPQYSLFVDVIALVPVCGFGTFSAVQPGVTPGDEVYDDTWPNIYLVQTEAWSDSVGSGQTVYTFSPYIDIGETIVSPPPGPGVTGSPQVMTWGVQVVTPTTLSTPYVDINGNPGLFTVTLSSNVNSGMWATWTGQAQALLDAFDPIPNIDQFIAALPGGYTPPVAIYFIIEPTSAAPGFAIADISLTGYETSFGMDCAACRGLGVRSAPQYGAPINPATCILPPNTYSGFPWPTFNNCGIGFPIPVGATICEGPNPWTIGYPAQQPGSGGDVIVGMGAVMSSKSRWMMTGQAPYWSPNGGAGQAPIPACDHLATYTQPMTLPGGVPTMGAVSGPLAVLDALKTYQWNPTDVTNALGSGAYGLIGFRPTAV